MDNILRAIKLNLDKVRRIQENIKTTNTCNENELNQLRIIHGKAIILKKSLSKMLLQEKEIPDQALIFLSEAKSRLFEIFKIINNCERLNMKGGVGILDKLFGNNKKVISLGPTLLMPSPDFGQTEEFINGINTEDIDELSKYMEKSEHKHEEEYKVPEGITGLEPGKYEFEEKDELEHNTSSPLDTEKFKFKEETPKGKRETEDKITKKDIGFFEIDKPTVIYYMMSSCPFCENFLPQWEAFESSATKKFPELQLMKVNVSGNEKNRELAHELDVDSFPTVIFFINGNMQRYIGSQTTEKELSDTLDIMMKS